MPPRALLVVPALLLGGALTWAILAGLDGSGSTQRPTSFEERKAVRIERRLARSPGNKRLLVAAMKTWIEAGSARFLKLDFSSKPIRVPDAVVEDSEAGLRAWNEYLRQTGGQADEDLAEAAASTYFLLVEIGSRDPSEATAYAAGAVRAEKIVCGHEPNFFNLSNLAVYQYYNGEYVEGDKTARRALSQAEKSDRGWIRDSLNGSRERGKKFIARVKKAFETLEETGEEELETPIKGYGVPAGINGYEPGAGPE
jgi:hypothetical protein